MHMELTRITFAAVVIGATGSLIFRVATAPERIRDGHDIARKVCEERGGEWVTVDRRQLCRRGDAASSP